MEHVLEKFSDNEEASHCSVGFQVVDSSGKFTHLKWTGVRGLGGHRSSLALKYLFFLQNKG